jgi:hypothetical protein
MIGNRDLFWILLKLFPSLISFAFTVSIVWHVNTSQSLRKEKKYFHQQSLAFAAGDIIQCISWFMGPRSRGSFEKCSAQEYLFQLGLLYKVLVGASISWTIFYMIRNMKPFSFHWIHLIAWFGFGILTSVISISFKTSSLYCTGEEVVDVADSGTQTSRSVYISVFLLPVCVCFILNLIFSVISVHYILLLRETLQKTLLRPVLPFPIIFSIGFFPSTIYVLYANYTGHNSTTGQLIAGSMFVFVILRP